MSSIKESSMAPEQPQEASEPSAAHHQCQELPISKPITKEETQLSSPRCTDTPLSEEPSPPSAPPRDGPKLAKEEEEEMFRALQAIFKTAEDEEGNFDVKGLLNVLKEADEDTRYGRRNVNALKGVRDNLGLLWRSGSDYMAQAAEVLANGSRDPAWRGAYGETGILDFFLRVIATDDVEDDILLHSLRLIGNSCADTNENRQLVVDKNYTFPIINLFKNPAVVHVAIPVIYNICVDFEPAQAQVAENGIGYSLLTLLSDDLIEGNALLAYALELLETATEHGVERAPDAALPLLINLATDEDIGFARFTTLTSCLALYLQSERFQNLCIIRRLVERVILLLRRSYDHPPHGLSPEDIQVLMQLRLRINQALSDISALPLFSQAYPLDCDLSETLRSWLREPEDQLQICACVMLGNLAREDKICASMVNDFEVHVPLISILNADAKAAVLHAVLGFLKNLAIATDNKEPLASAGIIKAVSRLWAFETVPQVQFAAASLTRQVIVSSFNNISRLLEPLSSDPDSPANSRTYLSLLLSLFEKSDTTPIKIEIGRTICAICRSINQRQQHGAEAAIEAFDLAERLYKLHEDVAWPLGTMITQTEWPVVQSEGWFALALMASTPSGSLAVVDSMQNMSVFQLISDTVKMIISEPSGGESVQEKTERLKKAKDRDNAIILVNGLLKNKPATLPGARREMLEDLMRDVAETYFVE
ncbi:GTP binding protein [Blastomyces dermatitidis ATCC 18188]|uniref:GTP binding protein n=1 Tax=Ajellomyces dermatitidis (strain ATCC 18188 / CBS 674.68) TaxID=653446 RepID=F2TNV5_AJEDA|nr:GTP binding protein [Blastomyces dermatitidis ATCC 18188]